MSNNKQTNNCDAHGEFIASVKNICVDLQDLKQVQLEAKKDNERSQREISLKIDNNQKIVLDKIEILIDRRFDDYRRCEEHRVGIMEQVDIKLDEALHPLVSSMADNVKSNTKFRVEFKYYLLAVATLAGFLKFFT
jgi:transcription initiation factor IIE alpha subunit